MTFSAITRSLDTVSWFMFGRTGVMQRHAVVQGLFFKRGYRGRIL